MKLAILKSALCIILLPMAFYLIGQAQALPENNDSHAKILSSNLTRVGNWPFGAAQAVAADTARQLVYLGSGGAVLVLDVSDLSNPQLVSQDINTTGSVIGLSYNPSSKLLFAATRYEGLQIWDVSNPAAPVQLAIYDLPDPYADPPVNNVDFFSNYVITENDFDGINSIDVSNPQNPVLVSSDLTGGNPARDIYVALDGRLHTANGQDYVKIYIEPNGHLNAVGTWHTLGGPSIASGNSDAAFLGVDTFLVILNTQTISNPVYSYRSVGFMQDIAVQGDFAYYTVDDRIEIYDVANYQNPILAASITLSSYPDKLDVKGDVAYVAGGISGLKNIDVEDPYQATEIGSYETFSTTTDVVRSGDYAYIAEFDDGMLVLDLSDISHPTLVGQYDTPGRAAKIDVVGNLAYIADANGGLRIADISDPVHPTEISYYDSLNWAREVCVSGNYAYLIDDIVNNPDYIRAIDISDPNNLTEVGSILMQSDVRALDASGNYLYAAVTDQGMRVLDISNPANPVEVGLFLAPDVFDVCVRGNYAYLASADWDGGFVTLDVSDPTNPLFVSTYNPNGWLHPFDATVEGDWAYVGDPVYGRLHMLYIGDPTNPRELGSYRFSGDLYEIYAKDSLVFISDGVAGLQIFKNDIYSTPGGGITWQPQSSGTTEDLWWTCFANSTTGWAVGNNGTVVKTTNGGQTWIPKTSGTSSVLFTVFFIDENTGWAAGRDGTIIKSTDGGESWQPQNSGVTADDIRSVQFIDNNIGWAAGESGRILYTHDGGNNWQPQATGSTDYLHRVIFTDGLHGWACGQNGSLLKTTDGGTNWLNNYLPTSASSVYDIYFLNPDTGWAATTDVEVFKTTNGGQTWIKQYENSQSPYDVITALNFVDENYGWAVGYNGKVISTSNGGNTWIEETSGVQEYLTSVCFADRFSGWIAGKGGTILKAVPAVTAIGNDEIEEKNLPDKIVLHNNYPNPFNPATTIKYSLPATSKTELKIYNILGEEIQTLVNAVQSPGEKTAVWNGRNRQGVQVGSGIYIYRLKTNEAILSKKMILIR